jgi:hypothetical protein
MKHFPCPVEEAAIIDLMANSSSISEWKTNAETIRQLNNGAFPPFWTTLLYEKPNSESQSVFEKAHSKWRLRPSGKKTGHI